MKYWIYNRTGMRVIIGHNGGKHYSAGQNEIENEDNEIWNKLPTDASKWYINKYKIVKPLMFSYPRKFDKKCYVKIANSKWSDGLTIDTAGMQGYLELLDKSNNSPIKKFEVGVQVENSKNEKFWRTKIVTFTPRFIIVNNMTQSIVCKQKEGSDIYWIDSNAQIPFHWSDENKKELINMSFQQNGWSWTGSFSIDSPISTALKIKNSLENKYYFPQLQVQVEGSTTFVIFSNENREHPPYMISNKTNNIYTINQKESNVSETIWPFTNVPYAWEEPTKPHILQVRLNNNNNNNNNDIGKYEIDQYKLDKLKKYKISKTGKFKGSTVAIGPTRTLLLNNIKNNKIVSKQEIKEEEIQLEIKSKITIEIIGIGISVIDTKPQEIFYLTIDKIKTEYSITNIDTNLEVLIGGLQLDNQLPWTPFPIVISPSNADLKSIIHFTAVKSNLYTSINYFKYMSILIQELDINIDEEFLVRTINLFNDFMTVFNITDNQQNEKKEEEITNYKENKKTTSSKMIYFEMLHINPVKCNVSFVNVHAIDDIYANSAAKLIGFPTKLLQNIDKAPLTLNLLLLKHPFTTEEDLINRITIHYKRQSLQQLYKILGSFEFLGSPLTLINNLGTGVYDFFHLPAQGIIKSPKDFGVGLAKGTKSLITSSVYGIFNTIAHITETINKGVGMLSMDADYERERQQKDIKGQPKHIGEGLLFGVRDLSKGIFKGVTGLVEEPVKGAKNQGVEGFFKGLGRGVIG